MTAKSNQGNLTNGIMVLIRDFPAILSRDRGPIEFGKNTFGPSKLGKIDTGPPF